MNLQNFFPLFIVVIFDTLPRGTSYISSYLFRHKSSTGYLCDVSGISLNAEAVDSTHVVVRFINTVSRKDVITSVPLGSNLLTVGDNCGVSLPRACRTGLCGSCTCEVKDPNAIDGFATIRACSANVFVPPGETEMVVDVHRMQRSQGGKTGGAALGDEADVDTEYSNPMARFSGDWEKAFISPSSASPQWAQDAREDHKLSLAERKNSRISEVREMQKDMSSTSLTVQSQDDSDTSERLSKSERDSTIPREVVRELKAKSLAKQSGMGMPTEDERQPQSETNLFNLDFNEGTNVPITSDMRGMWSDLDYLAVQISANTNGGQFGSSKRSACAKCKGTGRRVCYNCNGQGVAIQGGTNNPILRQCLLCVGMCTVGCPTCQGDGYIKAKRKLSSR